MLMSGQVNQGKQAICAAAVESRLTSVAEAGCRPVRKTAGAGLGQAVEPDGSESREDSPGAWEWLITMSPKPV